MDNFIILPPKLQKQIIIEAPKLHLTQTEFVVLAIEEKLGQLAREAKIEELIDSGARQVDLDVPGKYIVEVI